MLSSFPPRLTPQRFVDCRWLAMSGVSSWTRLSGFRRASLRILGHEVAGSKDAHLAVFARLVRYQALGATELEDPVHAATAGCEPLPLGGDEHGDEIGVAVGDHGGYR